MEVNLDFENSTGKLDWSMWISNSYKSLVTYIQPGRTISNLPIMIIYPVLQIRLISDNQILFYAPSLNPVWMVSSFPKL
jgi:hypothetical protein